MKHFSRLATAKDRLAIKALYESVIGTPNCIWSLEYPTIDFIDHDIAAGMLYCLCDEDGNIIACASGVDDDLHTDDDENQYGWTDVDGSVCEIARVCVRGDLHGQGLSRLIMDYVMEELTLKGYAVLRLLVAQFNPVAQRLYQRCGFTPCGAAHLYDCEWFSYEKILQK